MAVVLACVKMPGGEQWRAMRRMNSLLIACYSVSPSFLLRGSTAHL